MHHTPRLANLIRLCQCHHIWGLLFRSSYRRCWSQEWWYSRSKWEWTRVIHQELWCLKPVVFHVIWSSLAILVHESHVLCRHWSIWTSAGGREDSTLCLISSRRQHLAAIRNSKLLQPYPQSQVRYAGHWRYQLWQLSDSPGWQPRCQLSEMYWSWVATASHLHGPRVSVLATSEAMALQDPCCDNSPPVGGVELCWEHLCGVAGLLSHKLLQHPGLGGLGGVLEWLLQHLISRGMAGVPRWLLRHPSPVGLGDAES